MIMLSFMVFNIRIVVRDQIIRIRIGGSSPDRIKPNTIKRVFVASPISMQHSGERGKIGWLGIRIMCPSGATCLSADNFFSELALYKFN